MKRFLLVTQLLLFSLYSYSQTITIDSPNGGQVFYPCDTEIITWTQSGSSSIFFNIDYSLDNGSTWASLATNYLTTTNEFNWTLPDFESTTVLVRVTDANTPSIFDTSDSVFEIRKSINLTSPNGGEFWTGGDTYPIIWSNEGTSNYFNIQYSTNNGSTWTAIASNYFSTSGVYNWQAPIIGSSNCLIRILDNANSCKVDISDATFTIDIETPLVIFPNGGETFHPSCDSYTITWNPTTFYDNISIDYSLNNGSTWTSIVTNIANDGAYDWINIPTTASNAGLIRVKEYSNTTNSDVSDAPFTIDIEGIQLLTPNGGEVMDGCTTFTITWSTNLDACIETFDIDYYNGNNWVSITNRATTGNAVQSYDWAIDNDSNFSGYLIRVRDLNNINIYDTSDAAFSFQSIDYISIVSPNGGDDFSLGDVVNITWNSTNTSGLYDIYYTKDPNVTTLIAENQTGNSYNWTIPSTLNPDTDYNILIHDAASNCKRDNSDDDFYIFEQPATLLTPNGGETLKPYCSFYIGWDTRGFLGTVRLEYSVDNGQNWTVITSSTANDGNYVWSVPYIPTEMGLIKVSASGTSFPTRYDVSETTFTIAEPLTILEPNGGENLTGCDNLEISWEQSYDCLGSYSLSYSNNSGSTWNTITNVASNSTGVQSYNWQLPSINSSNMLVRVETLSGNISDQSDATFSLQSNTDISLTYPTGGQSFEMGEEVILTWTSEPNVSGLFTIQYRNNSSGNGAWTTITTNATGNTYAWITPNVPGEYYKIRVFDTNDDCKEDIGTGYFTIEKGDGLMTYPNGGESIYARDQANITWNTSTFFGLISLEYSLDGGVDWTLIDSYESNDGSYSWTLPLESSTNCLVRVSETADPNQVDISDAPFTIKPLVTILVPNGDTGAGSILGGCAVTSIAIDRSPAYSQYRVEYSTDNGMNWNTITNYWNTTGNPTAYTWTTPNVSSDQCLVRVYPSNLISYSDVSDNTFTIKKAIEIIQPSQGGFVEGGTNYDITWASNGNSNVYDIYYSTNNGSTWNPIVTGYTTSGNSYTWSVPNFTNSNCLIRIEDNLDNCKEDESDQNFIISNTPAPITLLAPNGGETIGGCSNYTIDWDESSSWGSYDISYSTDLGASWTIIETNYATNSSNYNWLVPTINEGEVLLRVKASGTSYIDVSDQSFVIDAVPLTVSPTSAMIEVGGTVQLTATGGIGTYSWSPSVGLNNANIANPVASPSETTLYTVTSSDGSCSYEETVLVEVLGSNLFVDYTATGTNDGSSWTNAFTDLQSALAIGENYNIHIAKGTYMPTTGTSRGATFDLKSNMTLLGGYPNGGGVRDITANETKLSGNVDGVASSDGNSYHVVSVKNVNNVVVDGLTIRDGNANVASSFGRSRGGGVFVNGSTVTFINSEIKWNRAIFGGGMFATLSPNVTFESCTFKKNTAGNGSALYHSNETNMYIKSSRITDNNSTIRCAIEVNNSLYTRIENSVIANNASANANAIGFIATNRNQTCDVYNSTILGETKNKNLISMQVGNNDQLGLNFYNSIIAHQNLAFDKAFIAYNNNILNLNTENCYIQGTSVIGTSSDNIYSVTSGDLLLNADYSVNHCSPVVEMGDNTTATQFATDIDGNSRIVGVVDMGAFEAQTTCPSSRENLNEKEIIINENVIVFPNPVNNMLFVKTELEEVEIFIYDILGERLLTTISKEIDMTSFPEGMYYLNIFSKGKLITTEKVVKR